MKKLFAFVCIVLFPTVAFAATYDLLAPIGAMTTGLTLADYLRGMFQFLIGMAGILAVVMIVWCGIKLMGSPSPAVKSEAKQCVINAILGILLAVGSWIILNTINSQLVLSDINLGNTATAPVTPAAGTPAGTYAWSAVPGVCPPLVGQIVSVVPPIRCAGLPPFVGALCCSYAVNPMTPPAPSPYPLPIPGVPPPAPLTTVSFTPTSYNVGEAGVTIVLTVTRSSGVGAGTVNYATANNNAAAGSDYTAAVGVLNFPIGVTVQTITITINEDTIVEGDERFLVKLEAPTGDIGLTAAKVATVYIIDNDFTPPPPPTDLIPPTVVINSPLNNRATTSGTVFLNFTAADNIGINRILVTYGPPPPGIAYTNTICELGTCPASPATITYPVAINTAVYGRHEISVMVCDTNQCRQTNVRIDIQAPCANTGILNCRVLPTALDPVFPICAPMNGQSGTLVGLNTHAYKIHIVNGPAGGKVYVAGGFNNEYPPQSPLEPRNCVPDLCTILPMDGSCTCVYGVATYDPMTGTLIGCSNDVPVNLVASISDYPGDLSSTPSSLPMGPKTVSGKCGSAGTGAQATWGTTLSTTLSGPGICTLQEDRDYYLNISTLPFGAASKGSNEYSLFWDYTPI